MVITIFLCTPLRIRYLQAKILCSCKGEGFFEGGVFPITTPVAATDLEANVTAPVDAEYDTDELAELPTDSDSEAVESEQGEDSAQIEGQ